MNTFRKYLLSNVYRQAEAGAGSGDAAAAAQAAKDLVREQIKVQSSNDSEPEKKAASDDAAETKDEDEAVAEADEAEEDKTEEVKATSEETEEATEDAEKLKKTIARLQKRIDKKTGNERDLQKQLVDAQAALSAKETEDGKFTAEDVKREAEKIANQKLAQKAFDKACVDLADAAVKVDKDFDKKVIELNDEVGPIPSHMVAMLEELSNGGAVLAHFVNNFEDAEKIFALPPAKQAIKLVELSYKLAEAAKPKPKKVSQAPAPGTPLNGSNRSNSVTLHDKMDDQNWIENRNRQVAEKRLQRPNLR